jgi:hypothetical protein
LNNELETEENAGRAIGAVGGWDLRFNINRLRLGMGW